MKTDIQVFAGYPEMSQAAARFMYAELGKKTGAVLCAASGNSPRLAYDLLAQHYLAKEEKAAFKLLSLDEWVGLPADHPACGAYQLTNQLIRPLDLTGYFLFDGQFSDEKKEIARGRSYLEENGPIDLCVLGIGVNGHLGFNEPDSYVRPTIHKIALAETSKSHNMITGSGFTPEYGITLGVGDILQSRKILLLVNGTAKRGIMDRFFTRQVTTQLPASFLWLHRDLTIFGDQEAIN